MSAINKRLQGIALHGIDIIADLADNYGGEKGDSAAKVLKAITTIARSVQDGWNREIDPSEVIKRIDKAILEFETSLAANDKAADEKLKDKFRDTPANDA